MKVIVVGMSNKDEEKARAVLGLDENIQIQIEFANSIEDIPIEDRLRSDIIIKQVCEFKAPKLPPIPDYHFEVEQRPKHKGWQRPYKYHK